MLINRGTIHPSEGTWMVGRKRQKARWWGGWRKGLSEIKQERYMS